MCLYLEKEKEEVLIAEEDIVVGKIAFINNNVYFCTNEEYLDGKSSPERFDYMYSWIFDYRVKNIIVDGVTIVEDYKILPEYLHNIYKTPYQDFVVEMGQTYKSSLKRSGLTIGEGLHSFAKLEDAKEDGSGFYAKCIIPKGAKYYVGSFNHSISFASDTLTYVEIVDHNN